MAVVQTPTPPAVGVPAVPSRPEVPRWRGLLDLQPLTLEQYHRMIETGILAEGGPIELLEGYLVAKDRGKGPGMGHGHAHANGVKRLYARLFVALRATWVVSSQLPITLPATAQRAGSEPEPDGAVADGPEERYLDHHPGPQELRLIAEVADSSLLVDRRGKGSLYAAAGIPLYWIIKLVDRQLEVYSDPDPVAGQYRSQQILGEHQQVILSWPGLAPVKFAVRDFLP